MRVEVIVSSGMPGFTIVGMPDTVIHESRERVRAALRSCGMRLPGEKIVFNLAPSYVRKTGSGFDFPMAVALLAALGQVPGDFLHNKMVVGELSLDGTIRPVNGLVAFQMCAFEQGLELLCAPTYDALKNITKACIVHTCTSLQSFFEGEFGLPAAYPVETDAATVDFSDVGGHVQAKRALQIAAAGNHGIMMMGPPGSGKTMLAMRLPTILPELTAHEIAESARIASVAGESIDSILRGVRPFRSPHHSATLAGLIGGGNPIRPGEVSLAHNGVLMLDELPEFSRNVLQGLRQPMEDGKVTITRADGNVVMPARFMLVASSNPCPCGYFGDKQKECTCPISKVSAYQSRIGGPLIDRFDMCIDVWRSDFEDVVAGDAASSSNSMREAVLAAREFAYRRFARSDAGSRPRSVASLVEECGMDGATMSFFKEVSSGNVLSGRAIMRTLSVARTIADMELCEKVSVEHIAEAVTLRLRGSDSLEAGGLTA